MMKLSNVTLDDGRMCVQLVKLLATGRWDLSGADAEALVATKKWLQVLAGQMGEQLKEPTALAPTGPAAPAGGFKVKAMGPIGSASKAKRKK